MKSLVDVPAPAKLNLFLHVVGRRADGYHLLQSVFVPIDWQDTLHFERRDDGALRRHDLGPALPADDLCLRAARLLQAESGCSLGADISIDKQVPWGAGLGGGSSDAASTLLALNRLWDLNLPRSRLAELALKLGADVPFFIGTGAAFVEGIGEQLTPISIRSERYAVVKPAQPVSTQAIFAHPRLVRNHEPVILAGFLAEEHGQLSGTNDLQAAAEAVCPEIAEVAGWLKQRFGNSRMTGSGSAVFARLKDVGNDVPPEAIGLGLKPGWVGRTCRSLPVHPLSDWAG